MVNFWKNNRLYFLVLILIMTLFLLCLVNVHAEENEEDLLDDTEFYSDDTLFYEAVTSDLGNIKNLLLNIKEEESNQSEYMQDIKSLQSELVDNEVDSDDSNADARILHDDEGNGDLQSDNAEQSGGTGSTEYVTETDNQNEAGAEQSVNQADEADYQSEVIRQLNIIHDDNLKIMLSLWALTGLTLGTKLISGMFGNG